MQQVTSILDRVSQIKPQQHSNTTSQPNASRKALIAKVWQVLLSRRLVTALVGSIEFRTFEMDTADLSEAQLRAGMEASKDFTGFFTFPAFRELCRPDPKALGMPDPKTAYIEACNKPLPWERQKWSHGAVFHAARETGRFELHSFTEREAFPLFKLNYERMCDRVLNGEALDVPMQKVLPESIPNPLPVEQARVRLAGIKELLA